jgi:hypothetical protein
VVDSLQYSLLIYITYTLQQEMTKMASAFSAFGIVHDIEKGSLVLGGGGVPKQIADHPSLTHNLPKLSGR